MVNENAAMTTTPTLHLTALFNKMRTLKQQFHFSLPQILKHCSRCPGKQRSALALGKMVKRLCLWAVIGDFQSILSVSVLRGPMFLAIIMIDHSVKHKPYSWALNFTVCALLKGVVNKIVKMLLQWLFLKAPRLKGRTEKGPK